MVWISAIASLSSKRSLSGLLLLLAMGVVCPAGASDGPVVGVSSPAFSPAELASIQKSLGIAVGKPIDAARIDEGIRTIHGQGVFQQLFVEAIPEGGGLRLVIRGTKLRRLRKLSFENVDSSIAEELRQRLGIVEGEPTDTRTFAQIKERLKEVYESQGYYFAEVRIQVTDLPETGEADVEVTVTRNAPTIVSRVTVIGGSKQENVELRNLVVLKKGAPYSKSALDESVEAIGKYLKNNQYPTSKVEGTNLNFTDDKTQVEVNLLVKMGEKFQFEFTGNHVFRDFELREMLTDEILAQPDSTAKIAGQIEQKYRAIGYHFCKVTTKNVASDIDRINIVRFQVDEGNRVIIDHADFKEDAQDYDGTVESVFFANAPGVIARRVYWEEGMGEAIRNLRKALEAEGYLNPSISLPKAVFSDDKKGVQLFFDVDLGTQTIVSQLGFDNHGQIPSSEVETLLSVKPGDPLNRERMKESRAKVLDYYREKGFADAVFTDDEGADGIQLSTDRKRAGLYFRVNEGPRYYVGKVRLQGIRKTKEEVVLQEMELETGDVYNAALMRESEEKIALLGLFSRVEIVPSTSPEDPARKDLMVIVRENRAGVGEVGLGGVYEEPRLRLRAFFGIAYRNLFGLNQTATARAELSLPVTRDTSNKVIPFVEYAALFGYRAPYPFGLPLTFSTQVGLDSFEVSTVGPTIQTRARIENRVERKVSDTLTLLYRLHRFERTRTENLGNTPGSTASSRIDTIGSTGPGAIVDFRDDIFNPTKGSLHTADVEFAHPSLGSQREPQEIGFVMGVSRNSFYIPLFHPLGLSLFAGAGYARSIIGGSSLPLARLVNDLSLGGQTSIRGFSVRRFSPSVANPTETLYYNARSELTVYLFSNISIALFFDSGQIYPNLRPEPRHDGVGVGFRYKTPVGPVVIDIAQGLGPDRESVKFYFTVGTF